MICFENRERTLKELESFFFNALSLDSCICISFS
jgi:hypothetical protein